MVDEIVGEAIPRWNRQINEKCAKFTFFIINTANNLLDKFL
jgi:hypothetical protein